MSEWIIFVSMVAVMVSTPFAVIVAIEEPIGLVRGRPTRNEALLFAGCLLSWLALATLIKIGNF